MNFNKLKPLNKKGAFNIAGGMTELMLAVILIGVFSVVVIAIILAFAPMIQTQAEAAQNESSGVVSTLWGVLATDNVVEILMVSTYIILVIVVLVSIITKATKNIGK